MKKRIIIFLVLILVVSITISTLVFTASASPNTVYGDVTNDGKLNAKDLIVYKQLANGVISPSRKGSADLDGDGIFTDLDYNAVKLALKHDFVFDWSMETYALDHYEEYLDFLADPSDKVFTKSNRRVYTSKTPGGINELVCEYFDETGETICQTINITETGDAAFYNRSYYGAKINYELICVAARPTVTAILQNAGLNVNGMVDKTFLLDVKSGIPSAIVAKKDGVYYFIEVKQEMNYNGGYNSSINCLNYYEVYSYEDYYEKYGSSNYTKMNICGKDMFSQYTYVDTFNSEYSTIPVCATLEALGAEILWNDTHNKANIYLNGEEYVLDIIDINRHKTFQMYNIKEPTESLIWPSVPGGLSFSYYDGKDIIISINTAEFVNELGYSITVEDGVIVIDLAGNEKQWNNIDIAVVNDVLLTVDISFEELLKLVGDVDGDGEIAVNDVFVMRRYLAGKIIVENINIEFADAFEDGRINAKDLLVIKKILAE